MTPAPHYREVTAKEFLRYHTSGKQRLGMKPHKLRDHAKMTHESQIAKQRYKAAQGKRFNTQISFENETEYPYVDEMSWQYKFDRYFEKIEESKLAAAILDKRIKHGNLDTMFKVDMPEAHQRSYKGSPPPVNRRSYITKDNHAIAFEGARQNPVAPTHQQYL